MRFITLRKPGAKVHAHTLLLTPVAKKRLQTLVLKRQDLRAVESELATTDAKMQNLAAAKNELEEQDERKVPGAFFDEHSYAEKERRRSLMLMIERKISICRGDLEDLELQRPHLAAEVDTLLEQHLDDLERAVRDNVAVPSPMVNTNDRRQAAVWWP